MTILEEILAHKKKELEAKKEYFDELRTVYENGNLIPSEKNFAKAIKKSHSQSWPHLIAEIKKYSPSKGEIIENANVLQIANLYEEHGASAISFLTDEKYFNGKLRELTEVSENVEIPVLRKDFILCEEQILEARHFGADGVLLMVSVLKDTSVLQKLIKIAQELNMDALVETHTEAEIIIALDAGAEIIGVNARDFSDLTVDTEKFQTLLPLIPNNKIKIAESGLFSASDVEIIAPLCDAILVGTALLEKGEDAIPKKIQELLNR